jgi:hypothetical protein
LIFLGFGIETPVAERSRADEAQQKADRLAQRLRELGKDV